MVLYIIKFSACLAIFMLFYKLLLERENMHHVKRWFLLASIILSLTVPFVTFTTYIEPIITEPFVQPIENLESLSKVEATPIETNYLPVLLWSIYFLGVLLFGIKFIWNLYNIFYKIKHNPKQEKSSFIHVLLNDLIIPHTFFNYIFLNKQKFETKQIPEEVFWHEQAHAKQKHSLDVLFLELLQIVFWFNPLIYLTKYSIKLNHEFLADQAVLTKGIQPSVYQRLLLEFSSNSSETQLANAINYSSIKKRFTVMKTHTSKQKIWLRSLLLLPIVGIVLYGFSGTKVIQKPIKQTHSLPQTVQGVIETDPKKDHYYRNITVEFVDENKNILESKKYSELTEAQKLQLPNPPSTPNEKIPTQKELDLWKDGKMYGVWIDGSRIKNTKLDDVKPTDFRLYYVSKLEKNAVNYGKHYYQVSLYSKDKYEKLYQNGIQPLNEGAVLRITTNSVEESYPILEISFNPNVFKLNGKETSLSKLKEDFAKVTSTETSDLRVKTVGGINMSLITEITNELKGKLKKIRLDEAAYIIGDDISTNLQQKATPEEVAEYNKLATYYSSQPEDRRIIKQKDLERMQYIYKKMSKEQKADAEPFPNMVPPPPAPPVPDAPKVTKEKDVAAPPPPPIPKSPLDHAIELSKKDASFFYEGKSISSDEAIKLLKENKNLNISTKEVNSKQPQINISSEPIVVNSQTKTDEIIMINGKKPTDGMVTLTKKEMANVVLTIKTGKVSSFKFKVPGKPTISINGNTLNDEAKAILESLSSGNTLQLFLIKNSDNAIHPPVFIELK